MIELVLVFPGLRSCKKLNILRLADNLLESLDSLPELKELEELCVAPPPPSRAPRSAPRAPRPAPVLPANWLAPGHRPAPCATCATCEWRPRTMFAQHDACPRCRCPTATGGRAHAAGLLDANG